MARANIPADRAVFNVYYIACAPTGLGYVGITSWSAQRRFNRHLINARTGRPGLLYDAMREFGPEAFSTELIEQASNWDDACEAERRLIENLDTKHPNGLNATGGGDGNYGYEYTDEVRARMSAVGKGRKLTEEHKAKIGAKSRGRKHRPESIAKLRAAKLGKKASEETRRKMAEGRAGKTPVAAIEVNIGSKRTPEQRARLSAALKGVKRSEQSVINLGIAARKRAERYKAEGRVIKMPSWSGKQHSPETKAKIAAGRKAAWDAKRRAKEGSAEEAPVATAVALPVPLPVTLPVTPLVPPSASVLAAPASADSSVVITVPAGAYYLGDPCYALNAGDWKRVERTKESQSSGPWVVDFKGKRSAVIFDTAFGDGLFPFVLGTVMVDSAMIGLVPVECASFLPSNMHRVEFEAPAAVRAIGDRRVFGPYDIDTNPQRFVRFSETPEGAAYLRSAGAS